MAYKQCQEHYLDMGLATPEQSEAYKNFKREGCGCLTSHICKNCNHIIEMNDYNTSCFCIPIFTCPHCNFKNGEVLEIKNPEPLSFPFTATVL